MMTKEELQKVSSVLTLLVTKSYVNEQSVVDALNILDTALAAPEPVAYMLADDEFADARCYDPREGDVALYTAPPSREFVGLTDEEVDAVAWDGISPILKRQLRLYYKAVDAALRAKNTGEQA